jgi:DNA-binding CsgD family transcriptional regulator
MTTRDYQRILDLVTALLDSGQPRLPWRLLRGELCQSLRCAAAVLFWTQGWQDAAPADFPPPHDVAANAGPAHEVDRLLHFHPLVRHYQTTTDRAARTTDDVVSRRPWPVGPARPAVEAFLGGSSHLGLPLPAPPGEAHVILLRRTGEPFTDRDREFASRLQPVLAALIRQQSQLRRFSPEPAADLAAAHGITARELTVLMLLAQALTAEAIGRRLGISTRTVHHHLHSIYGKLGTHDRLATVLRARSLEILPMTPGAPP